MTKFTKFLSHMWFPSELGRYKLQNKYISKANPSPVLRFVALVGVCLVMTIVGICLYLKNKVHKDTVYSVDDIESLHSRNLKKQVSVLIV